MRDPETKTKKEQEWADRLPDTEEQPEEYEETYRDGSMKNECWREE